MPTVLGALPHGTAYKWQNSAVYISHDGGATWQLFLYFPN